MSARVFILRRQGGEEGPYSEEEVLDALDAGALSPHDWCRLGDQSEAQRLGEVFERVPSSAAARTDAPVGEEVVYRGSPSWMGYGWPVSVSAGVLAAGYWLGQFGVTWVVGALAVALGLIVRLLLHRGAREYVVTTERVEATVGLLAKRTRQIHLRELQSIRLHRPRPLGWLGVGTVIFSGDGGSDDDVIFERVGRVNRVIALVRDCQRRESRP